MERRRCRWCRVSITSLTDGGEAAAAAAAAKQTEEQNMVEGEKSCSEVLVVKAKGKSEDEGR